MNFHLINEIITIIITTEKLIKFQQEYIKFDFFFRPECSRWRRV
jgi:hypothetical protein